MQMRHRPHVRLIEHTADLAIEVDADTLPDLFDGAATGMIALIEMEDPGGAARGFGRGRPV
jgi:hypothetical protein